MSLTDTLELARGEMVALIGAGGKTTTLLHLAKELRDNGAKVLATTTTKIFKPAKPHIDRLFLIQDVDAFQQEIAKAAAPAIIGAGYGIDDQGKLLGLPTPWLDQLHQSSLFDAILVEADFAAARLFKVPSELEPVIPGKTSVVIWLMATKALGKPLNGDHVHRAERALALLNVPQDTPLTNEHVLRLVMHPQGCLKGVPAHSRKIALINQADSPEEVEKARELAELLSHAGFERTVITSYAGEQPIKAAIRN